MKITDLKVHVVHSAAEEIHGGSRYAWVFVQIETDEGVTGLGECSNWPRRGNLIVANGLRTIKDSIIGADPAHIERIWSELFRSYTYLGNRGFVTAMMSGINIALWDIKGKTLGRPIYDLLGGPMHDSIRLYTHCNVDDPVRIAELGKGLVAKGWTALKLDPFHEMEPHHTAFLGGVISREGEQRGAELVAALREAVGPRVEILIDAHGNFNVASAVRCARALAPYDLTWFEEPVPPEGLTALRSVRKQVEVNLCVGERLFTRWDFQPILDEGLADYIMPDVCWTGGISELKKIANMAESYFVPVSPHNALGPIQIIAGAQTMMSVPNFYRLELLRRYEELFGDCLVPALDIRGEELFVSDRPGLGHELNPDFIAEHRDPEWDG